MRRTLRLNLTIVAAFYSPNAPITPITRTSYVYRQPSYNAGLKFVRSLSFHFVRAVLGNGGISRERLKLWKKCSLNSCLVRRGTLGGTHNVLAGVTVGEISEKSWLIEMEPRSFFIHIGVAYAETSTMTCGILQYSFTRGKKKKCRTTRLISHRRSASGREMIRENMNVTIG